ncbi:hypothetical protein RUM44_001097 [Polyplax serrata]|uniref:Uncharacterized protein n=1 Tax=Polyplax serrata TaxID=468196 RepID=A0ABR1B6N1_POLSC
MLKKETYCFNRVLQSHSGFLENSSGRKVSNEKFTSKSVHPESAAEAILDVRKSNRSKFDGKKSSARRRESLLNASKSNIYRAWNKNWKKVDKYKHKSRRNRLKQKDSDGVPGEVSEENPRCNVKYFCCYGNSSAKYSKFRNDKLIQPTNTVLDPKISLHPSEKAFSVKGKNHPGSFKNRVWQGSGISLGKSNETGVGNRRKSQGADDDVQQESEVEKWKKTTRNLGTEEPEKFNRSTKRPQNTAKSKTWPHFVYHLVSSNLVFPYGKTGSHHPNSYVAISVANDSV